MSQKPPSRSADAELHAREEMFRQIVEHTREVFWVSDVAAQKIIYVSPAYEEVWGRSTATIYADPRSFLSAVHPDDRGRVEEAIARQASGDYHEEYRVVRPDGSLRWVRARSFPLRDDRGEVYRIVGIATDITERHNTFGRERLRSEELYARLGKLLDSAQDAVITIDSASTVLDWNAAAERIFGWSRDEAVGKALIELVVPAKHREAHQAGLRRFLDSGEHRILNQRIEMTALNRAGEEFPVELAVWPVKTGQGWTFSSFIRDISERKRADEALRRSEERYRAVVENANEGIIVTQGGFIKLANPRAGALSDRTPEEVYKTPFVEMIHPDDRARVYGNYLRRMRGEPVENLYVFRVVTPKGEVRSLLINAVAIEWEGKPATLNFLSDVTKQMELQENLARTLAEREAILETTAIGLVLTADGVVKWINAAAECGIFGGERGAAAGKTGETVFASHGDWSAFLAACQPKLAAEGAYEGEWPLVRKDGSRVWCQVSARAVDKSNLRAGVIWFCMDISARKRAEEEIRRALARERELSELKTRFVALTSHEFRTPLATILSSVELLEDHGESLPANERREVTNLIKGALRRMTEMLDQVLLIGRAETKGLEFHPAPLDAAEFCAGLLEETRRAARDDIRFVLEQHGTAGTRVLDAKLLRHALANLLSNAARYSPAGSTVTLGLEHGDHEVVFHVADQGIGIPPEDQARLFESFYRGRNVGNVTGTGLGLAIARQCAELHGGGIEFSSEMGRGSTFILRVPAPVAA